MISVLAQADSVSIPLPDESVNVICCSPPYYRARHYEPEIHTSWPEVSYTPTPAGRPEMIPPWTGPLGWEPTHWEFIGHLVYIFRELYRVLRPHGVAWVVIGDKYIGSEETKLNIGAKGSMLSIPHLLGLALSAEGWLWRADVVWSKVSSCTPESIQGWRYTDRKCACAYNPRAAGHLKMNTAHEKPQSTMVPAGPDPDCPICEGAGVLPGEQLIRGSWRHTRAHEYILMLAKHRQYFCDHTQAWEPAVGKDETRRGVLTKAGSGRHDARDAVGRDRARTGLTVRTVRNPRSVVSPRPYFYRGAHTAPYNPDSIAPLIRASCPKYTCVECGIPWAPVIHQGVVTGYRAVCDHPDAPTVPGTVLDPFVGSGSTGVVCKELGFNFIGLDLSYDYLRDQAQLRVHNRAPRGSWDDLPLFDTLGE